MDVDKIVAALGSGVVATNDGLIIRGSAIRALEELIDRKATIERLSLMIADSCTLMAVNGEQFAALDKASTGAGSRDRTSIQLPLLCDRRAERRSVPADRLIDAQQRHLEFTRQLVRLKKQPLRRVGIGLRGRIDRRLDPRRYANELPQLREKGLGGIRSAGSGRGTGRGRGYGQQLIA